MVGSEVKRHFRLCDMHSRLGYIEICRAIDWDVDILDNIIHTVLRFCRRIYFDAVSIDLVEDISDSLNPASSELDVWPTRCLRILKTILPHRNAVYSNLI